MYRRKASEPGMADERLHGEGSGQGPDGERDALAASPGHGSTGSVCLCSAHGSDSSLPTLALGPRGGAGPQKTHKTGHGQHDVIQLRGAVDVLPPTAQTEYCTTFKSI